MAAAQKAIDSGIGIDWYGGEELDLFVVAEFEKIKNETSKYDVWTNNCKEKAGDLLTGARKSKRENKFK